MLQALTTKTGSALKNTFRSAIANTLVAALLFSALPQASIAQQVQPNEQEARSLLLLVREAANLATNREVQEELQSARKFLEDANSNRGGGEVIQISSFSRVRDILRKVSDEPRGESNDLLEKVAKALRLLETWSVRQIRGGVRPRIETAFGLHTATFDTLQGTVTANLPDDMAAGDTISGTVIAEPSGKTEAEQAKNRDELSGYVIEIAKQETRPDDPSFKSLIPTDASLIPVVLKNKDGEEIARAHVPVKPKERTQFSPHQGREQSQTKPGEKDRAFSGNGGYQTPSVAQAGKPLEVLGAFDGDLKTSAVRVANAALKPLAESPRKLVAQGADAIGSLQIEVMEQGKMVANCRVLNLAIRLAAEKLNMQRGEQTTMTVTVLGLDAASRSVSSGGDRISSASLILPAVRLINKSPGVVRMEGGETQTFTVDPKQIQNGTYTTQRTLTGVQPGGFSINATLDYTAASLGREAANRSCSPSGQDLARNNLPAPKPGGAGEGRLTAAGQPDAAGGVFRPERGVQQPVGQPESGLDADGNPRHSTGSNPVSPLRGRFRVILTGYAVNRQTRDAALEGDGVGDEVTLVSHVGTVDREGRLRQIIWGNTSTAVMGQQPRNQVRAGEATEQGGLRTGDGFPSRTPWVVNQPTTTSNPPALLFQGELMQGENAAVIIPTIWEWDGPSHDSLQRTYAEALNQAREAMARRVRLLINVPTPDPSLLDQFMHSGSTVGIGDTVTLGHGPLGFGEVNNRPIGMRGRGGAYGFTPRALVLTYDLAREFSRRDFGRGPGVIPIRYLEDPRLEGDYTLFLKIETAEGERSDAAACSPLTVNFAGSAVMTTTNPNASGPFSVPLTLTLEFTGCRRQVRVVSFPPLSFTFDTRTALGMNTTRITQTGGGSGIFNPATGHLDIPLTLNFANTVAGAGTSVVDLSLSTGAAGGQALNAGSLTLVGTGRFRGGFLNSSNCRIVVAGTFTPSP